MVCDEPRGPELPVTQLRVGVQIPAPLHDLPGDGLDPCVDLCPEGFEVGPLGAHVSS